MKNEYSIKLEIYKSPTLPTEKNKMLGSGPSVNDLVKEAEGIIGSDSYNPQKWTLLVKLTTGEILNIKEVQAQPFPGETLKVRKLQSGDYEMF